MAEARREVARWGARGGPRHGRPPDTTPQAAAGESEASGSQRKRRQTDNAEAAVAADGRTEAASTTPQQSKPGNRAVAGANVGGRGPPVSDRGRGRAPMGLDRGSRGAPDGSGQGSPRQRGVSHLSVMTGVPMD